MEVLTVSATIDGTTSVSGNVNKEPGTSFAGYVSLNGPGLFLHVKWDADEKLEELISHLSAIRDRIRFKAASFIAASQEADKAHQPVSGNTGEIRYA